jgi:hypothetical protein
MRVWNYNDKQWDELGRVQWEIESIVLKPEAMKKVGTLDDIDPDADTYSEVEYRDTKESALARAEEIYKRDVLSEPSRMASHFWRY